MSEQLDLLRELAVEMKRTRLTAIQSAVGVAVLSRLRELNVEPNDTEALSDLCNTLNNDGIDIQHFMKAALSFEVERGHTRLGVEELEARVKELQKSADRLKPLADLTAACRHNWTSLMLNAIAWLKRLINSKTVIILFQRQ